MRALLLSAYDAGSHRSWHSRLVEGLPEFDWTVLTLPPRHFSWRVRSNPLTWTMGDDASTLREDYDLVLSTSLVDVATLRGLVPKLSRTPWVTYWHENQFAYPLRNPGEKRDPNLLILQLYTALASDKLVFNSQFNRRTFLAGVEEFGKMMPDGVPHGVVSTLRSRSSVVPVPLDDAWFSLPRAPRQSAKPLTILWNHRWEYDKAPDRLLGGLRILADRGIAFRLLMLGQAFRKWPAAIDTIQREFSQSIDQWGYVDSRDEYQRLVACADVVVSTAIHEFQGIAVQEACASGCLPVVPNRLSYPEFLPAKYLYASNLDDAGQEAADLANKLTEAASIMRGTPDDAGVDLSALKWSALRSQYLDILGASFRKD